MIPIFFCFKIRDVNSHRFTFTIINQKNMRFVFIIVLLIGGVSLFAQSKKELTAQVKSLEEKSKSLEDKNRSLQTEIDELKKSKAVDLANNNSKVGYGMGVLIANNVRSQGADSIDIDALVTGFRDVYENQKLKMEQQQCSMVVQTYMQQASEKKAAKASEGGRVFLEENKKNPGVVVTASGLQYKVIISGNGKTPVATDKVTVNYAGKLIDGTEFDSSLKAGRPAEFRLNQVIRGWTEVLQLMKEGDKWMVYIPYELGYGERGMGGAIPPYATLIFEVELIKVN